MVEESELFPEDEDSGIEGNEGFTGKAQEEEAQRSRERRKRGRKAGSSESTDFHGRGLGPNMSA